jgi:hypothetical protein
MNAVWISALGFAFPTLGSAVAFAQPGTTHEVIAYIEGTVFLDGQRLEPSASRLSLKEDSSVRTENGRVEILLAGGDTLFVGQNGSIRFSGNRGLNSSRFEILSGSAVIITGELGPAVVCEEEVQLSDSGVFRFDVHGVSDERFCRVRVYKGAAAAQMPSFVSVLTNSKMADLNRRCGDHTQRNDFNIEDIDGLDRWSRQLAASDARRQ